MTNEEARIVEGLRAKIDDLEKSIVSGRIVRKRLAGFFQSVFAKRYNIVIALLLVASAGTGILLFAATITAPTTFTTGTPISSTAVNSSFATLYTNDENINTQLSSMTSSQWSDATGGINYAGGKVGIGTATPSWKLDVLGNIQSYSLSGPTMVFLDRPTGNWGIIKIRTSGLDRWGLMVSNEAESGSNAGSNFSIVSYSDLGAWNKVALSIVRDTGYVGILTSSPASALQVVGTVTATGFAGTGAIGLSAGGTDQNVTISPSGTGKTILNGNVGIGTTTPGNKLDIVGDLNITGSYKVNGTALTTGIGGSGTASYMPKFATGTTLSNSILYESSGNIGVGTTDPASVLQVNGTVTATGFAGTGALGLSAGGSNQNVTITPSGTGKTVLNGNVGIGATSPTSLLYVKDNSSTTATVQANIEQSGSGDLGVSFLKTGTRRWTIGLDSADSYKLKIAHTVGTPAFSSDTKMMIDNSGNVGIGTTTLNNKLEVAGDLNITGSYKVNGSALASGIGGSGTANYLPKFATGTTLANSGIVESSGNIGIGTTTPVYTMTVSGGNGLSVLNPSGASFIQGASWSSNDWAGSRLCLTRYRPGGSVANLDTIGYADFMAYDGSSTVRAAQINSQVDGTVSTGIVPGLIRLMTTDASGTIRDRMVLKANDNITMATNSGKVGVGTTNPYYKLDVIGDIRATGSVYYGGSEGAAGTIYSKPDYVFEPGYEAMTIDDVAAFVEENHRLPWLTPAKAEASGAINMTRMNFETLEALENMQLQVIALARENKLLREQNEEIARRLDALENAR